MSDRRIRNVLILETNNLTALTTNSIEINMPHFQYKIVKPGKSKIATALHNIKEITLVVKSGMVLNIKDKDLPKIKNLMKYDMCVSRQGVYTDHPSIKKHYKLTTNELHKGMIDLSLFIMNKVSSIQIKSSMYFQIIFKNTLFINYGIIKT